MQSSLPPRAYLGAMGRAGRTDPVASGEKLHDGIAGAKLVEFEKCGHVPEIDKPSEFNQTLVEFLGK